MIYHHGSEGATLLGRRFGGSFHTDGMSLRKSSRVEYLNLKIHRLQLFYQCSIEIGEAELTLLAANQPVATKGPAKTFRDSASLSSGTQA